MRDAPPAAGDCLEFYHLNGVGVVQPEPPDHWGWDGSNNIYMSPYMTQEWGLPERQIMLCGDGHMWITLDYRDGATPVVTWLDSEAGPEFVDRVIAPLFDAFRSQLLLESEAADAETGLLKPQYRP